MVSGVAASNERTLDSEFRNVYPIEKIIDTFQMTDAALERLIHLNQLGIIPGPDENEDDFVKRAEYCLSLKNLLETSLSPQLPFDIEKEDNPLLLEEPCQKTKECYDIAPLWIPVFFSNYQLAPWHGGCAWIFQINEEDPTGAFFQLRQSFRYSQKYLGIYSRNELVAHEISHVGRMMYQDPKFEEILAYQTSSSAFRRWFGPIVQSSIESMFFIIVLIFIAILDISLIASGNISLFKTMSWIKLIPCALVLLALYRLGMRHRNYSVCLKKIKGFIGEDNARHVLYRLQDREIEDFSVMTPEEIQQYAREHSEKSLRWKLIHAAYFKPNFIH